MFFSTWYFLSNSQLKAIFEAYQKFSKKDIEADIKSETSGNLCKGLLTIGKYISCLTSRRNCRGSDNEMI
jgi:hypothetical protein